MLKYMNSFIYKKNVWLLLLTLLGAFQALYFAQKNGNFDATFDGKFPQTFL